ncbi:MAG: aminomethyl-transferring glycine dehydrogenase, partial [Verrucomicrobiales bacterium]
MILNHPDKFIDRHIGPEEAEINEMLHALGLNSLQALVDKTIPAQIQTKRPLNLPNAGTEFETLARLKSIASQNKVFRSFIGMGYSDCITPPVIQRNILENPGWYTQYTPYQAEISQGRLESLLNFQTMIMDLTGLDIANASLLDEATAAAEAMNLAINSAGKEGKSSFLVSNQCHPQNIDVVQTRASALAIEVEVTDVETISDFSKYCGVLLQYPATDGRVLDLEPIIAKAKAAGTVTIVCADILALTILKSPGEMGADIAVGNAQRFGVPLGYGGPHAAYFACRDAFKRQMPGRLVGVSRDVHGRPGYRLSLQTREQHIRREKATSNICTAQALLANMSAMYAVYHGPDRLKKIAHFVHDKAALLAAGLQQLGHQIVHGTYFDTIKVTAKNGAEIVGLAASHHVNLRSFEDGSIGIALDETTQLSDIETLLKVFNKGQVPSFSVESLQTSEAELPSNLLRRKPLLPLPIFNKYHSETEILRYIHRLQSRDISLTTSMIPLGSCTMKLNATSEMYPVSWPEFSKLHPFAPLEQSRGYQQMFQDLENWLAEITGFSAVSLQPNAGSQGEYAGLLAIQQFHAAAGNNNRRICLIPTSAHGTNPASAVMAGFQVVAVACDAQGNIDVADLTSKAEQHAAQLAALMVTYPSTHGVFEESIVKICSIVHQHGGLVYMDGANLNAQVGLCRPAELGADVCHIKLHKTFCIPHGGGGPGMGPICVVKRLAPFLPKHPVVEMGGEKNVGAVSAAPWG